MKHFLFILIIAISQFSFACEELAGGLPGWTVVSDSFDSTIPEGQLIIEGNIKMFSSALPLDNVRVGTSSGETLTDSLGNFKLTTFATDSLFYCFKEGWSEIYEKKPAFRSQHHIVIDVYLFQEVRLMKKPIIYLYGEEGLEVDLQIAPKGEFTFTYPTYKDGWQIALAANGNLLDKTTGKMYPYLFWEGESRDLFFDHTEGSMEGWLIKTDTAIQFLEKQLAILGLNATEKTDFITFWGPIIEGDTYALIQFLVDDQYEQNIASLTISPKPDSQRRVYLLTAPLDQPLFQFDIVPQIFKPFNRSGFTIVEWGGTDLNLNLLNP